MPLVVPLVLVDLNPLCPSPHQPFICFLFGWFCFCFCFFLQILGKAEQSCTGRQPHCALAPVSSSIPIIWLSVSSPSAGITPLVPVL